MDEKHLNNIRLAWHDAVVLVCDDCGLELDGLDAELEVLTAEKRLVLRIGHRRYLSNIRVGEWTRTGEAQASAQVAVVFKRTCDVPAPPDGWPERERPTGDSEC